MNFLEYSIDQILEENQIPHTWSRSVKNEVTGLQLEKNLDRKDLSESDFVTIDGKDAKDFDDAVLCKKLKTGYKLLVAIADVSSLVRPGSAIDKAAKERGTSIYFPNTVIPMLPEEISNDLCSLVPNKIRNVVVSDITFDDDGEIKNYDFYEAKIESKYRLTYKQVEEAILKKKEVASKNVNESINALKELTITLLDKRARRNALEIESSEPMLKINNMGEVESINLSKRMFAHQMIEEAMIAANICAIMFVKSSLKISINRFHDRPDTDKLLALFEKFQSLGLKKSDDPIILLQRCIELAKRSENATSLQSLILQGLPRAIYSSKKSGHFGLQLEEYSHFTSPIRRYPDLIIHRLIKSVLKKEKINFDEEAFEEECVNLSNLEKRAEKSSRQVSQQLICFFLKDKVGNVLPARVVGVTHFGVFCELEGFFVSGLMHVSDLKDDHYVYSERNNILKGKRSGKTFKIGDQFNVRIDAVIPEERKIILSKNK